MKKEWCKRRLIKPVKQDYIKTALLVVHESMDGHRDTVLRNVSLNHQPIIVRFVRVLHRRVHPFFEGGREGGREGENVGREG